MKNGLFTMSWATFGDAALMAAITAIVVVLVQAVGVTGFNVFHADWVSIGENAINFAFIAAVLSFGQDFLSTNKGSILGLGASNEA